MLQSTPSARSHPIIGSTQANNWWPITRNWSIVCVRNILGVCWSKQEEDWWVWLLYKSRAINLCWKGSGKEIRRHVYMTCSLGTSWPFPLVLFCVAYSHTEWKYLASVASLTTTPRASPSTPSRWIGTVHRCVVQIGIGEKTYRRAALVLGQHMRLLLLLDRCVQVLSFKYEGISSNMNCSCDQSASMNPRIHATKIVDQLRPSGSFWLAASQHRLISTIWFFPSGARANRPMELKHAGR